MSSPISYLDFDLQIVPAADGRYRTQVLNSPSGEASAYFVLPFSELELENFLLRVGRPRRGIRRLGSPEMEAAKALGKRLYDSLFSGEVNACWRSSLDKAGEERAGLRLRLRIADAPELNDVPWEYLYNAGVNRFLSLSRETPLVRYLELPERIRPLAVTAPLRLLVIISSPTDYPSLEVEREWARLNQALGKLIQGGLMTMERLEEPRLPLLQRKLRGGEYHILHFIGHGGFNSETKEGVLVLCDEAGKGRLVGAQTFGTILHDHRSLRLAVLNACEGSRASRIDPFAGTAQTLVQQGIPGVVAMQFEITDKAAITFAEEFYSAIADGYPIDAGLAEARKAIFGDGNDIEWGTPVLYLRAPDGRLFSVSREVAAEPRPTAPAPADGTKPPNAELADSPTIADPRSGAAPIEPEQSTSPRERLPQAAPSRRPWRRLSLRLSAAGLVPALLIPMVPDSPARTLVFGLLVVAANFSAIKWRWQSGVYALVGIDAILAVDFMLPLILPGLPLAGQIGQFLWVLLFALEGAAVFFAARHWDALNDESPKEKSV